MTVHDHTAIKQQSQDSNLEIESSLLNCAYNIWIPLTKGRYQIDVCFELSCLGSIKLIKIFLPSYSLSPSGWWSCCWTRLANWLKYNISTSFLRTYGKKRTKLLTKANIREIVFKPKREKNKQKTPHTFSSNEKKKSKPINHSYVSN